MRDVVFLLLTAAFFVVCLGYLALCGRIVGPDPSSGDAEAGTREELSA